MRKFKSILLAASAVILGFSMGACDDDDTTVVNEVVVPATGLNVPVAGQEWSFDVTSSVRPTVSADAPWIIIADPVAAENNVYKLNFTIEPNTDKDGNVLAPRTATIAVSAFNAAKFITVTQEGKLDYNLNYGDLPMQSSAAEIAAKMGVAVNLGNSLESVNIDEKTGEITFAGETAWGNPIVNQAYIAGIKAMGFDAVRIPCAWYAHYEKVKDVMGNDSVTTTIDPAWMARVKEVVSYCIDNDLYVVLNDHYDVGWIEDRFEEGYRSSLAEQLADMWTQIATEFNPFDEHLVFAGLNEPGMNGTMTPVALEALTKYEQVFIDAVRATGGNNATRTLVVQGPQTNIDATVDASYVMPVDPVADRLMVEIHFYDPYQFCLMEEDADWGKTWWYYGADNHVAGSDHNNGSYGDEAYIAGQFKKMHDKFVANGIPVIVGEYGPMIRTADKYKNKNTYPGIDDAKHAASRAYWNEVVTRAALQNGCVPFYWEIGGDEGHGDINRYNGQPINAYAIDGIMRGKL